MTTHHNIKIEKQINQCLGSLKKILKKDLLAVYLYGSAIVGGLQKYSDIDLFVVVDRPTTIEEKKKLTIELLQISGIYMKSEKLPIELTITIKSEINPWHYPPKFDFQYGEWLREKFEKNIMEPWTSKIAPDLALLITQILLASKTLLGPSPNQLLSTVPYHDFILATKAVLKGLKTDLDTDTRNVLLTYARIWSTLATDTIRSKPAAANWAMNRLPKALQPVLERAKSICIGKANEYWEDIKELIQPCANFIINQINEQISLIENTGYAHRSIHLDSTI